jgi:hypothetical protein
MTYTKNDVGRRIRFPHTGSVYEVVDVNDNMCTLTFAAPGDPEDSTTETFEALAGVDAEVLR